MWLTRLAVRNPIAVFMLSIAVMVLAWVCVSRVPIDLFPGLNVPAIQINTNYTGANPEEIERTITYPLENAVSRVNGIARLQSTSSAGKSNIQIWFDWGANLDSSLVQVISNVQRAMKTLPPGVDPPSVSQFDVTNFPIVQLSVEAPQLDPRQLYEIAEYTIAPQIKRIHGVADCEISGGLLRQINVNCDPQLLQSRGLSLQDVATALRQNNQLIPSGQLINPKIEYQLQIPTQFQDVATISEVVVATRRGIPIKLKDVAKVVDGSAPATSIRKVDGREGVGIQVLMQPHANVVQMASDVKEAVPHLAGIPKGVTVRVVFDQSIYVRSAVTSLVHEGIGGAILVSLVTLVFLRSFRSVVIICISIPLSVAAALVMLYLGDQTLNIFTLGGLTLALGRLVDDAIVVRENITRHQQEQELLSQSPAPVPDDLPPRKERRSDNMKRVVLAATGEVGMPVLASTLTTIAVFVPVVFLQGISQKLFVPLAETIIFSMTASYFVSMTVDPVLSIALMPRRRQGPPSAFVAFWEGLGKKVSDLFELGFNAFEDRYERFLRGTLARPILIFGILVACLASAGWFAPSIPTEFFPESDEAVLTVTVQPQLGTGIGATGEVCNQVESMIREEIQPSEMVAIITTIGNPSNQGRVFVRLKPAVYRKRKASQICSKLRKILNGKFAGVQIFVSPGGLAKRILNYGAAAPIDVQVLGHDQETGTKLAIDIANLVRQVTGATDVQVVPQGQVPSFRVDIDRDKSSLLGLTPAQVASTINTAISGGQASSNRFADPYTGNEFALVTQLASNFRSHPEDLGAVPVGVLFSSQSFFRAPGTGGVVGDGIGQAGTPLRLRDIASIRLGAAPLQIQRKNQVRVIDVTANCNAPLGQVTERVRQAISEVKLPEGFSLYLAGQSEQQKNAFASMSLAAGLALMLVYMIMASQFGSLWEPLVIMLTVPLGLVGVVWMQLLTGTAFSVMSFMGVIMMVGIVVSNGILMVEFAKTLEERGQQREEAIIEASRTRLRPIVMTAVATIVGMIPMATGLGGGSETNQPLAKAVIGGLTVSTVLTLFVIPLFYRLIGARMRRHRVQQTPPEQSSPN